jgi:Glycosyl transferase family 2
MPTSRIAGCLIVGPGAGATLGDCIASIRDHVDEINIYDTGSDPDTKATLAALTSVHVFPGTWRQDFAWAREQAFALPGPDIDWLFWLDADDVLEGPANMRELARSAPDGCDGFALQYEAAQDQDGNPVSVVWRERLLRRRSGYRWEGVVHEVLVAPENHGELIPVDPARLRVVHRPLPGKWERGRNVDLLAGADETDLRTLFYRGRELAWHGDFAAAAERLQRYIERRIPDDADDRLEAITLLSACLRAGGDSAGALRLAEHGLSLRPDWGPLAVAAQEAAVAAGDWGRVETCAMRALELPAPSSLRVTLNPTRDRILPAVRLSQALLRRQRDEAVDGVLGRAAAEVRNGRSVEETRRRVRAALADGSRDKAEEALVQLAARYDEERHAVVRGLRLQAERALSTAPGASAHA